MHGFLNRIGSFTIWLTILTIMLPANASAQDKPVFELLHLWAEDIEAHALDAFAEPMRQAGVAWSEQVVTTNFKGVRETYAKRLANDVAPTASFWIGGGESTKNLIDEGVFRLIKPTASGVDFLHELKPEVYEAATYQDGLAVLPVGIHLQNFSIYSQKILDELGEEIPDDWDAFLRVAEKAKQAGYPALSVSDETWQLRFFAAALLAENLNADQMRMLSSNGVVNDVQRQAIRDVFVRLAQLRPYMNPDMHDLNWKRAVENVVEHRALMSISGDFIAPLALGKDNLVCHLPPGNRFVSWSFDSIAFTNTDQQEEIKGQELFAEIVFNPENITEYVTRKGGLPVTKNGDATVLPPCAKASVEAWETIPGHVRMNSQEWMRSLAMIANYTREYLNAPTDDNDGLTDEVLEAVLLVWQNGGTE